MKLNSLTVFLALIPLVAFAAAVSNVQQPPSVSATSPQQYSEYRNDQWHFSIFIPSNFTAERTDVRGGATIQFIDAAGNEQFQVSAWPYKDLDVALGEEAPAGTASDQPDTLAIVHAFRNDLFEITFVKNGISYLVQSLPENATSTLERRGSSSTLPSVPRS